MERFLGFVKQIRRSRRRKGKKYRPEEDYHEGYEDVYYYASEHFRSFFGGPETVSCRSVSCCLEKETNPQLSATTLQEVVESDKPRCLLDVLKRLNVLPKLRGPELDTALKVWPDQCQVHGKNDLPAPAGHTIPDPGQDAIDPLGHLGTLLAHVQLLAPAPPGPFPPGHCPGTVSPAYNTAGGYCGQSAGLSTWTY
ncbi:hypothetical protein DUI87_12777 [Hirundo rustica rustica]|uniref:Uncharacterized protein n=1 Tax=Hirundo rustica rustica TaxID=333673 RepID=A0A3M0KS74_HIRRU|nr:hypothetical protein DUI87_12777 [Hirundo rustica rustica]